jgi:hypothetical protein
LAGSEYIKQCIEFAKSSRWSMEALARAQFHLATLYEEQGEEAAEAKVLKGEARKVLEKCRDFAAECVRETKDEMMIFDDLQPTFQGRYTGHTLLKCLQKQSRQERRSY